MAPGTPLQVEMRADEHFSAPVSAHGAGRARQDNCNGSAASRIERSDRSVLHEHADGYGVLLNNTWKHVFDFTGTAPPTRSLPTARTELDYYTSMVGVPRDPGPLHGPDRQAMLAPRWPWNRL